MSIYDFCHWLENSSIGLAIGERAWLFPMIETCHVLALTVVFGSIAMIDLRLLGWSSVRIPVKQLNAEIFPYTWTAFVVATITGSLLFVSNATTYYANNAFRIKLLLLALAGLNMAFFHTTTYRQVDRWNNDLALPLGAKIAGSVSLITWIGVVIAGRLIGFL